MNTVTVAELYELFELREAGHAGDLNTWRQGTCPSCGHGLQAWISNDRTRLEVASSSAGYCVGYEGVELGLEAVGQSIDHIRAQIERLCRGYPRVAPLGPRSRLSSLAS